MNPKKKIYFIKLIGLQAILLMLCTFSYGQLKCQLKHYSTEDGLSHEKITSILKDKEGFMWFGTWDGINRFDGHNFISFKSHAGDNSNLENNRIYEMQEGIPGYLWIRDDKYVYKFDKRTGHFFPPLKLFGKSKTSRFVCSKIVPSKQGVVWLLSENEGIIAVSKAYSSSPQIQRYGADQSGNYHLPGNKINFFCEDSRQDAWIGTSNGLVHLETDPSGTYHPDNLNNEYSNGYNFTSVSENGNNLAFTTREGFLILYDKRSKQFIHSRFVGKMGLNAVCFSHENNVLYCSTGRGELLIVNRSNLGLQSTVKVDNKEIFSIYEDHHERLWIEPKENGVFKYDLLAKKLKYFNQKTYSSTNIGTTYEVFEDVKGNTWLNMKGHGYGYYDVAKDTVDPFYNDPNFENYQFSNRVIHQYYDEAGVLWLSTESRGLEKIVMLDNNFNQKLLVPKTFIQSENEVRTVYYDSENRLWIGTKENLYTFFDNKQLKGLFVNPPAGGLGHIYTMCEDHNGNIWFGTKSMGLYKAEPLNNERTKYRLINYLPNATDPYSISSDIVYSIIEDRKGRIWVGTHGGGLNLVVTNNNETKFYNPNNVFKDHPKSTYLHVRNLMADQMGYIWIGTTDGLLVCDPGNGNAGKLHFKSFSKVAGDKESLGNNDVQFICRDRNNKTWLCTSGGGLNLAIGKDPFNGLTFKAFTIKNGLSNDFTLSCIEDNNGKLWIATQKGISEFNTTTGHFKNYGSNDGLPQTGFSESSCLKLPDGNLIFGAFTGYLEFNPEAVVEQKINALMALTNLQIDGKDVSVSDDQQSVLKTDINYTSQVTVNYDQNDLNLMFSVLDYRTSDRQAYTYRLLGLDTTWIQDDINHLKAIYSNLPPGDYVFQVKSSNEDQYIHTPLKQLPITVLPPPWRTWWAYVIYTIIAIVTFEIIRRTGLTMLRLRQRIAVEQHLTELKLNFFTNISHELRTPLTLILNPIEAISKDKTLSSNGKEYAQIIMKNANRMVRFINQLLDLRKVQSGNAHLRLKLVEIVGFIKNISSYFNELGKEKNIEFTIISSISELYVWVDEEKLDIVIYNLLSNAYKFSDKGSEIIVEIEEDQPSASFRIKIIDEGIGVPKDKLEDIFELYYEGEHKTGDNQKGTGIGLALAKELITLHRGKIFATNNNKKGLTITIELKLGKPDYNDRHATFHNNGDLQTITDGYLPETRLPVNNALTRQNKSSSEAPLVLLVEDSSDLRHFLAVQLGEIYRVAEAENGKEGYIKALNLAPDLIVSDIMMPVMDGIQMLDKLKNDLMTSHIPVILLSAKYSVSNQVEGLKYGADFYITKPFNNELLMASVSNLLQQRKKLFDAMVGNGNKMALSPSDVVITVKDEDFLKKVISVVEEGMSDPDFNIDNFADAISMSRSVFFRKLKSLTNSSPVEFVRDMRIKRGKQLLDAGETNIAQVAYAVGFNDAKYFGACFKKQYHHTPSEYLKNVRA